MVDFILKGLSITVLIISTDDDVCFLSGYRTVDALLQRMFEADLDPEDFAEHEEAQSGNFSNPTFSSV